MDPRAARRAGFIGTLFQNLDQTSPHTGMTPGQGAMSRQVTAERYNAGAMPWQLEQMKAQKMGHSQSWNDYHAILKQDPSQMRKPDGSMISFREYDQMANTSSLPASLQEMKILSEMQKRADAGDLTAKTWIDTYWRNKRASKIVDVENVPTEVDPGGGAQTVASQLPGRSNETFEESRGRENRASFDQKVAEKSGGIQGEVDSNFQAALANEVPEIKRRLQDLRDTKAALDNGTLKSGIAAGGPLAKLFNPEAGKAYVTSTIETLKSLSQYQLTPVSDADIAKVEAMFIDAWANGDVNAAKLGEAIGTLESILTDLELKRRYFYDEGNYTLEGYRTGIPVIDLGDGYQAPKTPRRKSNPRVLSTKVVGE